MPRLFRFTPLLVGLAMTSLPQTASAAVLAAPSSVVAGSSANTIETVRMHRMKRMRRGNPSARGWKKNF